MSHASLVHPRSQPLTEAPPRLRDSLGSSIRSELMKTLSQEIAERRLTRPAAARLLGVAPRRINELLRGETRAFSIDALVSMIERAGGSVKLKVQPGR